MLNLRIRWPFGSNGFRGRSGVRFGRVLSGRNFDYHILLDDISNTI